jgi:hypothetical protein
LGEQRKTYARCEFFRFGPNCDVRAIYNPPRRVIEKPRTMPGLMFPRDGN